VKSDRGTEKRRYRPTMVLLVVTNAVHGHESIQGWRPAGPSAFVIGTSGWDVTNAITASTGSRSKIYLLGVQEETVGIPLTYRIIALSRD
jgi:hypothetical protein